MPDDIDWDQVEREQRGRRSANYNKRQCPACGRTISEGAYSGSDGNWKKHVAACEKKRKST